MVTSESVNFSGFAGRIHMHASGPRWPRILGIAAAAVSAAQVAVVALPRYTSTGDLRREIAVLAVRADALGGGTPVDPQANVAEKADGLIEPAALLATATGAARRAGLQVVAIKQMLPLSVTEGTRRLRLEAAASFDQVVSFLDEIAAISPTLRVETLSLMRPTASAAELVKLDVECTLSLASSGRPPAVATSAEKAQ